MTLYDEDYDEPEDRCPGFGCPNKLETHSDALRGMCKNCWDDYEAHLFDAAGYGKPEGDPSPDDLDDYQKRLAHKLTKNKYKPDARSQHFSIRNKSKRTR